MHKLTFHCSLSEVCVTQVINGSLNMYSNLSFLCKNENREYYAAVREEPFENNFIPNILPQSFAVLKIGTSNV